MPQIIFSGSILPVCTPNYINHVNHSNILLHKKGVVYNVPRFLVLLGIFSIM